MKQFTFATTGQIIFGAGSAQQAATEAANRGRHALIVYGRSKERAAFLRRDLEKVGMGGLGFGVDREPDIEMIGRGSDRARRQGCDLVIACGGGSVIDAGKAIAAMLTNPGQVRDYLEVIGDARPLSQTPAPFIAIPTTAGTGSEVTRNAVLRCPKAKVKVSMRSPMMLPDVAIIDPVLTLSLPPAATAATGFDALTQLLEAFVSNRANPVTDAICRQGLTHCARSLKTAYRKGNDLKARTDMALASMLSGLALANAGLGAVHGIAGPLGGMVGAPHGAVCARLLPFVSEANLTALDRNGGPVTALARYSEAAQLLTQSPTATIEEGLAWLRETAATLHIPPLSRWGLKEADIPALVSQSLVASSMKGNPVRLTIGELAQTIKQAMESDG